MFWQPSGECSNGSATQPARAEERANHNVGGTARNRDQRQRYRPVLDYNERKFGDDTRCGHVRSQWLHQG